MGETQARLIAESVGYFARMRRVRTHPPTGAGVTSVLRGHLSYRIPCRATGSP